MTEEKWLTPRQVCTLLGISKPTLVNWNRKNRIPFLWTPLGRLYDRQVVEELARERGASLVLH